MYGTILYRVKYAFGIHPHHQKEIRVMHISRILQLRLLKKFQNLLNRILILWMTGHIIASDKSRIGDFHYGHIRLSENLRNIILMKMIYQKA